MTEADLTPEQLEAMRDYLPGGPKHLDNPPPVLTNDEAVRLLAELRTAHAFTRHARALTMAIELLEERQKQKETLKKDVKKLCNFAKMSDKNQ